MKRLWLLIAVGCLLVALIVVSIVLLLPKAVISSAITKQLTFTLLLPKANDISVNRNSVKYDTTNKLLTYTLTYGGTNMVVSEQPTPEQFVDIPTVYTKLVDGLNNYESFDAAIGTVHLTKPAQLKGKQAAVMNSKGTLMFAKPDKDLTSTQWRIFFNNLQVAQ